MNHSITGRVSERLLLSGGLLVCIISLGAGSLGAPWVESFDHPLLDATLSARAGETVDTSAVAIVLIDDATLAQQQERWPLRRHTWAELVRKLASYKPAAIAIDAWFEAPEPTREVDITLELVDQLELFGLTDSQQGIQLSIELEKLALSLDGDRQLAASIAEAGNVILGVACLPSASSISPPTTGLMPVASVSIDDVDLHCGGLSANFNGLAVAARAQAGLDVVHDDDGFVRRYPLAFSWADSVYQNMAPVALAIGRPESTGLNEESFALDSAAPILNAIAPEQFTIISAADLLMLDEGQEALEKVLSGRIVFVGVSAMGTEDQIFGSFSDVAVPGVIAHANMVINILNRRHITSHGQASLVASAMSIGLLILLLVLSFVPLRPRVFALLGSSFTVLNIILWFSALAFGFVIPFSIMIAALVYWLIIRAGFSWWRNDRERKDETKQKQALLSELEVGRSIQLSMVPKGILVDKGRDRLHLHATLHPAKQVGGDLYDFFFIDDDHLCFYVGDVSGKGVPAALFMAVTMTLVKSHGKANARPAEIIANVNDDLAKDNEASMFVTVFLGIINVHTGHLRYCNGGHNPPLLRRAGTAPDWIADRHGPVLGAMDGLPYGEGEMQLESGDVLLVYSDGVTEAQDISEGFYDEPRLLEVFAGSAATAKDAVEAVLADVWLFQGEAEQADDVTILALEVQAALVPHNPRQE